MRYSYAEQAAHYRMAARDRGCTCPDLMAPHTHLLECPLYEVPGGVPSEFHQHLAGAEALGDALRRFGVTTAELHERLDQSHELDAIAREFVSGDPHAAASAFTDLLIKRSDERKALREHLDQSHDADDGRPWI